MIRHLWLMVVLIGPAPLLAAQLPLPLPLPEAEPANQPEVYLPLQDIAAEGARVESHLQEAATQLTAAKQALESANVPRGDEDEQGLQERIALLKARTQVGRRHLQVLADAKAVREERQQLQGEVSTWNGFSIAPPFSFEFVAAIARKLRSQQAAMKTDELRLAAVVHGETIAKEQVQSAEKAFRQALEALEAATTDEEKQKARAQRDLSRLSLNVQGEGAAFSRASEQLLRERLALHQLREEFSGTQLTRALQEVRLAQGEFQDKLKALEEEVAVANERLARLSADAATVSRQLAALRERVAGQKQRGDSDSVLPLEIQLRQEQLEALHATIDDVNLHIGYLQMQESLWRNSFDLRQHWDFAKAKAQIPDIDTVIAVVDQGIAVLQPARTEVGDFQVERQFDIPELAVPRNDLIGTMQERSALLDPTLRSALQLRDLLGLWKREIEVRVGDLGATAQVQGWDDVIVDYLKRLWSFELLSVEDTLVVDGQRMIEQRPVTISKVIEAILILTIGLLLASVLARLLSRIVLPFSAEKWHSRLLIQKLLRVGMITGVVVLALITVKIPLTVFAFLGGAIVLGIGFGMKNLLTNFISGFILLAEGIIRVGDRIEIEGTRGIVEKIGERSTRVHRLDGMDILIPNSHFLESSVMNLTLSDQRVRITIQVGVAYGSPTRQVHAVLLEIAQAHELVVADPAPVVVFEDFGDSALLFNLYVWIDLAAQDDYRAVVTELRHRIGERFAESGYEIAFPQRDLHLSAKRPIPVHVLAQSGREAGIQARDGNRSAGTDARNPAGRPER